MEAVAALNIVDNPFLVTETVTEVVYGQREDIVLWFEGGEKGAVCRFLEADEHPHPLGFVGDLLVNTGKLQNIRVAKIDLDAVGGAFILGATAAGSYGDICGAAAIGADVAADIGATIAAIVAAYVVTTSASLCPIFIAGAVISIVVADTSAGLRIVFIAGVVIYAGLCPSIVAVSGIGIAGAAPRSVNITVALATRRINCFPYVPEQQFVHSGVAICPPT